MYRIFHLFRPNLFFTRARYSRHLILIVSKLAYVMVYFRPSFIRLANVVESPGFPKRASRAPRTYRSQE